MKKIKRSKHETKTISIYGKKKQSKEQIAIKVNEVKIDVASVTSRTNQVFSRIVGDTKISVNNNGVELEAPKIIVKE